MTYSLFNRELIYLPIQKKKKKRISFSLFFFLLFEPLYSIVESRELVGQEMESELQINQSCLMSWYCNTQTDVTGNWWMPHLHVKLRQCRELVLQLFGGYLRVWLITSSHCFILQPLMLCEGRELIPDTLPLLRHGDSIFFLQIPSRLGPRQNKETNKKRTFKI